MFSKLRKSNKKSAWNLELQLSMERFLYLTYCMEYVWKSSLWIGRVYFKELVNVQEYYWQTIYRAGAAIVSTTTSSKLVQCNCGK